MDEKTTFWSRFTTLDAAIYIGIAAIFLAIAVPLVRGAFLRRQMAECAHKMMCAADAIDFYAATVGRYPSDDTCESSGASGEILGALAAQNIDWWEETTEMGGSWGWLRRGESGSIAICNPRASEKQMRRLDRLIDDGDLSGGTFRRYGSVYCYLVKQKKQV